MQEKTDQVQHVQKIICERRGTWCDKNSCFRCFLLFIKCLFEVWPEHELNIICDFDHFYSTRIRRTRNRFLNYFRSDIQIWHLIQAWHVLNIPIEATSLLFLRTCWFISVKGYLIPTRPVRGCTSEQFSQCAHAGCWRKGGMKYELEGAVTDGTVLNYQGTYIDLGLLYFPWITDYGRIDPGRWMTRTQ